MNMKRFLSLILSCVLVLSMAACGGPEPTQPTTVPTTQPTTQPTTAPTAPPTTVPSEPDPAEIYDTAAQALSSQAELSLTVQITRTLTIGDETFVDKIVQAITYIGFGTEELQARISETVNQNGFVTNYAEYFQGGMLYTDIDDAYYFCGEMTPEEYTGRYAPPVMLDAALYEEITKNDNTITFSSPTAGESWIVPEYAELIDATGFAKLNASGAIFHHGYDVTYAIGGNEIRYEVDTVVNPPENRILDTVSDPERYTKLDYVDAPRLIQNACGYLFQACENHSLTTSIAESFYTQAGGAMLNRSTAINSWGFSKHYTAEVEISVFQMSVNGEDRMEQTERFEDNSYTVSADGSDPKKEAGVTAQVFKNYVSQHLLSNIPNMSLLTNATAEDLGSLYYLELTFGEEMGESMCGYICDLFWADENFLNDLSSDYKTETMDYYLAIDKYTGLPTAVGFDYKGKHTIQENDYPLTVQSDQSFTLYSTTAYKTLTDKVLTPAEPEEKATPLFYHVTGPNGEEMWLLGTIHVGDARTSYLPQKIYDAFDAADALAVEFNSEAFDDALENDDALASQVSSLYFYDDGSTTADHIEDEELYTYAKKLLKATGNYNMNMPYAKAYLWGNSISNFLLAQFNSLSSQHGVDNQLIWRAQDQNKPIYDVESGLFQVQMLTGFSDPLQEMLLLENVAMDPLEYAAGTQDLFEMWCSGDEAALSEYLNQEEDTSELTAEELALLEEYNNAMETDRNDDMLDVAIGYLESGEVVFYAVGLAHLLAEDGLVNTLRGAGYTVELVEFD